LKPHRRVFVVGGASTPYIGKARPEFVPHKNATDEHRNPTLEELMRASVLEAFETSGADPAAVDKGYVSNFLGECFVRQGHLGSMLAAVDPALEGKPFARIEAACASGSASIAACIDAMQAGADVTMVAGVEVETNVRGSEGVDHMALAAHWEQQRGLSEFVFPYLFGRRAKAWKEAFGGTAEDLARIVHKAYVNANRNPKALNFTSTMTLEHANTPSDRNFLFLEDPELHDHMRLTDCTAFTDGASTVILATEDGLKRLGLSESDATEILGYGHTVRGLGKETDGSRLTNVEAAAAVAYADSGVSPGDVGVAEVHDCFSVTEAEHYAALGFCDEADAPARIRDGTFEFDGAVPVNPGGGLIGAGHPIGATGVRQVLEVHRQLRGLCGDYQLAERPRIGVTSNLGGDDRTGIVMVHRAID
jgi:acetyl-CoA acetyltransferase